MRCLMTHHSLTHHSPALFLSESGHERGAKSRGDRSSQGDQTDNQNRRQQAGDLHPRDSSADSGQVRRHRQESRQRPARQTKNQQRPILRQYHPAERPISIAQGAQERQFPAPLPHTSQQYHRQPQRSQEQTQSSQGLKGQ